MTHRWIVTAADPQRTRPLESALGIGRLLAHCLIRRGLEHPEAARAFLEPRLKALSDPFTLPEMDRAVDRLFAARDSGERVVIFGDYDVDGVTATTLLETGFCALGWQVDHFLPHRLDEGYGLSQAGVENCLARFPVTLLLAVDCGSTAVEQIRWLTARGVDVLVLDHHQVSDPRPAAVALVNPQLAGAALPDQRELCSAGLAFKLLHAVLRRGRERDLEGFSRFDMKPLLDLVALGTVADLVPMVRENRILVTAGLKRLETTARPGLVALKEVAQTRSPVGVYEVGFQLGPRLNASGRLETAEASLELLLAQDVETARPLAEALDATNRDRQAIEKRIAEEVLAQVRAKFRPDADLVIVEGASDWHIGVVGIVAARVLREFYRPTLIFGGDNGSWRGSGRSVAGFDLAAALRECGDLLEKHGGHAMAAGVTLRPEHLDALRVRLNDCARRVLRVENLLPELQLDAEVPARELTVTTVTELMRLQPFGQGNPAVQILIPRVTLACPPQRLGREQQHWKLRITDGGGVLDVLWWGGAEARTAPPGGTFDLAAVPQLETYNGRTSVRLKFLDWRPSNP
ncbi:MAG: single-stranded-DNA-specific exonuclease RecJ [Verrucomicrobia bacterium]|nr:single-stranded-DNA-specific exonuclease RecJ [Verrucomicrobiota bacterium]